MQNASAEWTRFYTGSDEIAYPAEGVIRILKGRFPGLDLSDRPPNSKIIDLGCGDGRHLPLFKSLGFDIYAVEVSDEIVRTLKTRMDSLEVSADIRTGHSGAIPFGDSFSDFLLSWNSCYYMSLYNMSFEQHVGEIARVLKPGGTLICSVPKKNCFIFDNSIPAQLSGYVEIKDDYFGGLRNGEIMRMFADRTELEDAFSSHFEAFRHADIDMDWFGLSYNWHVLVAQRTVDV